MADQQKEGLDLIHGQCNCGAIKISLPRASYPPFCGACHCENCRASAGSLFSINLPVPFNDVTFVEGTPKTYTNTENGVGKGLKRYFCGDCGSPIMSIGEELNQAYLKGGIFVKTGVALPKAVVDAFWARKEKWEVSCTTDGLKFEGTHV